MRFSPLLVSCLVLASVKCFSQSSNFDSHCESMQIDNCDQLVMLISALLAEQSGQPTNTVHQQLEALDESVKDHVDSEDAHQSDAPKELDTFLAENLGFSVSYGRTDTTQSTDGGTGAIDKKINDTDVYDITVGFSEVSFLDTITAAFGAPNSSRANDVLKGLKYDAYLTYGTNEVETIEGDDIEFKTTDETGYYVGLSYEISLADFGKLFD